MNIRSGYNKVSLLRRVFFELHARQGHSTMDYTVLSDRIEIESYSVIESNVLAQIESTRIQIEWKVFPPRFLIRFDSILKQKIQNKDSKK
jgi:hypothetical protein